MVVSLREFVVVILGSVVLSLLIIAALSPWMRNARRLTAIAIATALGIIVWNVGLNVTNATSLNVDSALLGLSAQDVGSGVLAFLASALALYVVSGRDAALSRILGISAIVGVVTIAVDLFA